MGNIKSLTWTVNKPKLNIFDEKAIVRGSESIKSYCVLFVSQQRKVRNFENRDHRKNNSKELDNLLTIFFCYDNYWSIRWIAIPLSSWIPLKINKNKNPKGCEIRARPYQVEFPMPVEPMTRMNQLTWTLHAIVDPRSHKLCPGRFVQIRAETVTKIFLPATLVDVTVRVIISTEAILCVTFPVSFGVPNTHRYRMYTNFVKSQ